MTDKENGRLLSVLALFRADLSEFRKEVNRRFDGVEQQAERINARVHTIETMRERTYLFRKGAAVVLVAFLTALGGFVAGGLLTR